MSKNSFGPCPKCPKGTASQRLYGTGVCKYHLDNPGLDNSKEKIIRIKHATEEINLAQWYKLQIVERPEYCEEPGCNKRLIARVDMLHFFVCHIVPKNTFPSVATHPLNRWFGCIDHHNKYDRSWDDAQKMGVWDVCIERFQQFMQAIVVGEHRHLPDSLRAILDASLVK